MGRLITHNTRCIQNTPISAEQSLREWIVKSTGHLEDIFTDSDSIRHNGTFIPYMAFTQVNAFHSDRWEDKILDQQKRGQMVIEI